MKTTKTYKCQWFDGSAWGWLEAEVRATSPQEAREILEEAGAYISLSHRDEKDSLRIQEEPRPPLVSEFRDIRYPTIEREQEE